MTVLGVIPFVRTDRLSVEGQAALVDSFFRLRRTLRSCFEVGEPITCAVTSRRPQEGKTFVATNLCMNFAEAGFRTLLVDGDARQTGASSWLGAPASPGLHDLLHRKAAVERAIHATPFDRLFVLSRGKPRPESTTTALLDPEALMDDLRARFDVVIIDAPWRGSDVAIDGVVSHTRGYAVVQREPEANERPEHSVTIDGPKLAPPLLGYVRIANE